jgi:hypothetical protein
MPRRRFQFSLRTLLIATAAVAVGFGAFVVIPAGTRFGGLVALVLYEGAWASVGASLGIDQAKTTVAFVLGAFAGVVVGFVAFTVLVLTLLVSGMVDVP